MNGVHGKLSGALNQGAPGWKIMPSAEVWVDEIHSHLPWNLNPGSDRYVPWRFFRRTEPDLQSLES